MVPFTFIQEDFASTSTSTMPETVLKFRISTGSAKAAPNGGSMTVVPPPPPPIIWAKAGTAARLNVAPAAPREARLINSLLVIFFMVRASFFGPRQPRCRELHRHNRLDPYGRLVHMDHSENLMHHIT